MLHLVTMPKLFPPPWVDTLRCATGRPTQDSYLESPEQITVLTTICIHSKNLTGWYDNLDGPDGIDGEAVLVGLGAEATAKVEPGHSNLRARRCTMNIAAERTKHGVNTLPVYAGSDVDKSSLRVKDDIGEQDHVNQNSIGRIEPGRSNMSASLDLIRA